MSVVRGVQRVFSHMEQDRHTAISHTFCCFKCLFQPARVVTIRFDFHENHIFCRKLIVMIHLEGVFYIIVLYIIQGGPYQLYYTVIHRVRTPLRVVWKIPVLTHLFIRPLIGVKQQGPTLYELHINFQGGPRNIHVWLHLEGAPGEA